MNSLKVILATMVIFACGVITGAIVSRTVAKPESPPALVAAPSTPVAPAASTNAANLPRAPILQLQRADVLKRLDSKLDLSQDQHDQIARIMKTSQERTQVLWTQIAPQMKDELKKVREEIRGVLTPDQRKQFAELFRPAHRPGFPQSLVSKPTPSTNAP